MADAVAEITLNVIKLPDIKRGSALLRRHRVIERDVGRTTRLRPLIRAQERLAEVPRGSPYLIVLATLSVL